jgi:hypothetical protein
MWCCAAKDVTQEVRGAVSYEMMLGEFRGAGNVHVEFEDGGNQVQLADDRLELGEQMQSTPLRTSTALINTDVCSKPSFNWQSPGIVERQLTGDIKDVAVPRYRNV